MPAPGQFIPRKSSAHRIACISLYRALLKQCPRIPLPDDVSLRGKTNPIKHFIQKAFRKNVYHTSPKLIVPALETGYAVHSLLHHAASSEPNALNPSLVQIHTILRTLSQSYSDAQVACPPKPRVNKRNKEAYPGAPKAVDIRPLPKEKLTGRRHVPKLVAVHGIFPFMRFKKPQSAYLSRVLCQKIKTKMKRFARLEELESLGTMASWEDVWDRAVDNDIQDKESGKKNFEDDLEWEDARVDIEEGNMLADGTWRKEPERARQNTWVLIAEEGRRNRRLGERMLEIIDQEQKLWEEERRERKHLKTQEKWLKKLGNAPRKGSTTARSGRSVNSV